MSRRCVHESCFPDTACALGHLDRSVCEHWTQPEVGAGESIVAPREPASDIPWNGYALGTSDLAILGGRGQPLVVGLIGPPDSGKTSLLAFVYMWLLEHGTLGDWQFASSWTLGGWESVVRNCRWMGAPPPSFPPHTSSSGRHPGILHVALRHRDTNVVRDVLFTDAPGEWFSQWSRAPGNPAAAGARWVVERADVLFVLLDSASLADPTKLPATRRATRDIIERVGAESLCPVVVVWTKSDVAVPAAIQDALGYACSEFVPAASTTATTVADPTTICACFVHGLVSASHPVPAPTIREPRRSDDPFLAFRGIHVDD